MPYSDKNRQREYQRTWTAAKRRTPGWKLRDIRRRVLLRELKEGPCMDCGVQYPSYVMQWDHREGEVKVGCISDMKNLPIPVILAEIEKCDLVCANCHAERTFSRGRQVSTGG